MDREGTGFGFPAFEAYKPGSIYPGYERDNAWFLERCKHEGLVVPADMKRITGIDSRSFADETETIISMALATGRNFLKALESKGLKPEQCKGLLLGTTAVEGDVLGLRTEDLTDVDEDSREKLVQRTAEKVAEILKLDKDQAIGQNYACSTTARLTELGIREGIINEGDFYLMIMAERMGANLDVLDRKTGFLFGDYTAATALYRGQTRFNILHAFSDTLESDNLITLEEKKSVMGPDGKRHDKRLCMQMNNGSRVLNEASEKMIRAIDRSLEEMDGVEPDEVNAVVPHQANWRFIKAIEKRWGAQGWVKPPPTVDIDVSESGNNGSASWARRMAEVQKQLTKGQIVMAPFVGAGPYFDPETLSVGNIAIEVGE